MAVPAEQRARSYTLVLGARGYSLCPRHLPQHTCRRVCVLDGCRCPYPGVVQQSCRATTSESPNGFAHQPPLLLLGCGVGLLDEQAPTLADVVLTLNSRTT